MHFISPVHEHLNEDNHNPYYWADPYYWAGPYYWDEPYYWADPYYTNI